MTLSISPFEQAWLKAAEAASADRDPLPDDTKYVPFSTMVFVNGKRRGEFFGDDTVVALATMAVSGPGPVDGGLGATGPVLPA